jgi:hypothetical protein
LEARDRQEGFAASVRRDRLEAEAAAPVVHVRSEVVEHHRRGEHARRLDLVVRREGRNTKVELGDRADSVLEPRRFSMKV